MNNDQRESQRINEDKWGSMYQKRFVRIKKDQQIVNKDQQRSVRICKKVLTEILKDQQK